MDDYKALEVCCRRHWNDFYSLPIHIYEHDPKQAQELRLQIAEELNPKKNPIAQQCTFTAFIVYKNDKVVARAVAIINNQLNSKVNKNIGQIGYLEFIEDRDALSKLIDICSQWFSKNRCDTVWTDTRFSLNYQVGIQVNGYDERHTFLMPRQPQYYSELLQSFGFYSIKNMNAYSVNLLNNYKPPIEITDQAQALLDDGFKIRNMEKSDLWTCLLDYNLRWGGNFAHTPFSNDELKHLQSSMNIFLDTRFCFLVEKNNELAGYLFTFPDYFNEIKNWKGKINPLNIFSFIWKYKIRKQVTGLKTAIIGVTDSFKGKRLSSLLNSALLDVALKNDCQYIERSWILEDNIASIKQAKKIGGKLYKQYSIFEIKIIDLQINKLKRAS